MALTRKFLTAMGIEADKVDEIINAHTETVDALKEQRDNYKEKADKADKLQKDLDDANKKLEGISDDDGFKKKYEEEHEAFEQYKQQQAEQAKQSQTKDAYRALLKEAGVAENRIDTVLKVSDLKDIELDKDGKLKDADKLKEGIAKEWADFITKTQETGTQTTTPPTNTGGSDGMTKEKIMAIKDGKERRAQIAAHPQLFGLTLSTTEGD